jgi:hypothetical protein
LALESSREGEPMSTEPEARLTPVHGPQEAASPTRVTLPPVPEIRRWIDRTTQERAALQERADRLREQFEPLRKQLAGIERSIKVLDHFLAQVSLSDDAPDARAPLRAVRGRPGGRLPVGQWSRKHAACRACGTAAIPHKAQGYCGGCYDREVRSATRAPAQDAPGGQR